MAIETTPQGPLSEPHPILPVRDAGAKLLAVARAQGTVGKATYENLLGLGRSVWETDEELDQFLGVVQEIRRTKG